jgi:SET family sugar efflux transporter-like MFS transporter
VSGWQDKNVRMLFIASTLMWTCNTMYIIDMPLWISSDLGLPDKLAGILMGTAAGLEIPAMILAGYYVKRFGKRRMMIVAVAAGVLFYAGLIFSIRAKRCWRCSCLTPCLSGLLPGSACSGFRI